MKITSVATYPVPPRWLFLRIETDDGLVGWGEPIVEGRAATVAAAVDELADHLRGRDPRAIEDIWTVLYRGGFYRGGAIHMSALAGIDQAKVDRCIESVATVREAVGPDVGVGVDFHGRVHKPMAKVLIKELEPYRLMFIEEPVLSEHVDAVLDVLRNSATPIALGERLYSRWDVKHVLASGAVDIIQPDPSHAGGITETRKIATMAEAYDVAVALHCPLGPIALATCLQLDAVTYNAFIQEQSLGIHYNTGNDLLDHLVDPSVFDYADGMVAIPRGPGLGIEVNEEYVRERAEEGHRWRNPIWRHADGSFAEW